MRAALALLALTLAATTAHAQSWLPPKGEGTVSVLFSNTLSTKHYLPDVAYDRGHIDSNTMLFDVTYGLTDRVAVTVGLPVVTSRYRGTFPHRPITLDDGNWHTSAQDFRMSVRYNVVRGSVQVTPFIGTALPANDYQFFAHAAPGRQLKEMLAGVSTGRLFAELGLVVQGQYAINISQGALDYARRYSTAAIESAYFLTPSVRLIASGSGRVGHTGIDLPVNGALLTPDQFLHHDQISRESFFNLGGGAAVSLTETTDLFFGYTRTVTGRNTHATNRGLSLGVSWSFGRQGGDESLASRDVRKDSLVRCLCEKKAGA
jgi:hypothetical protein